MFGKGKIVMVLMAAGLCALPAMGQQKPAPAKAAKSDSTKKTTSAAVKKKAPGNQAPAASGAGTTTSPAKAPASTAAKGTTATGAGDGGSPATVKPAATTARAGVEKKAPGRQKYYHEGDKTGFAGLAIGGSVYDGDLDVPPLTIGFDYGWHTNWSLGGSFTYTQTSYDYGWPTYDELSFSYYMFLFRASYHFKKYFDPYIKDLPIDPFFTLMVGYIIMTNDYSGPGNLPNDSKLDAGATAGIRYWFTPNWAAQVELGYTSSSKLNLGIARKF